ncbi:MAG: hypothetical protein WA790_01355 [Sulfitobacter sp.]
MYRPRSSSPPPQHLTSSRTGALNRLDLATSTQVFPAAPATTDQGPTPATASGASTSTSQSDTTDDTLQSLPQSDVALEDGGGAQTASDEGGPQDGGGATEPGAAMPAAVFVEENDTDAEEKASTRKKLIFPPEPRLPMPNFPDMNAIRSPIVRAAPADAQTQASDIIRDTGTSPSQHHANIQSAVFRVSEATRNAQRDLVQNVDSIATNTRWSIEEMAIQVDGIVERCAQVVAGAARRALAEIDLNVAGHEAVMRSTAIDADLDMEQRRNDTSQEIVNQLNTNGSAELLAVHERMGTAYDATATQFATAARTVSTGVAPTAIPGPPGTNAKFTSPQKVDENQAASFNAEATRLAGLLPTSPAGGSGKGGTTDPYYLGYIAFRQAGAMADLGRQATADWDRNLETRITSQTSVAAKNQFLLSMLGIVAPTAGAMKADEEDFKDTLDANVIGNQRNMSDAKVTALKNLKKSHFGVQNFFDPSNPKSMPAKVIGGLRDNGALIKHGLMSQAKSYEANITASVESLAAAYPDLIDRLEAMLTGDDLMHGDIMLPRIEGISATVRTLLLGHLEMLRGQSRDALDQARTGLNAQTRAMWKTVDKTLGNITEHKLKSNFHFAMEEAMFTGNFTDAHIVALEHIRGYAEKSATRLMAPISAGREAGERVDRAVVDQFNRSLHSEYSSHVQGVGQFQEQIGFENPPDYEKASATDGKPLHKIHADEHARLIGVQEIVDVNLPQPKTAELLACGLLAIGGALFTGGASLVVGAAAIGGAYFVYASLPKKSAVAGALGGIDWPGAMAMNAIWTKSGRRTPDGYDRVEDMKNDDSDWENVFDFFSSSKQTAVDAKAEIVGDAGWLSGIDGDAIESITRSLNDGERALLDDDQIKAMDASIRHNLFGLQEERALAYLKGDRALVLAIRFKEAIATARAQGDDNVDALGQELASLVSAEMNAPGYVGFASPQSMQTLENQMYVSLAAQIPGPGNEARSVPYAEPAGADDLRAATPQTSTDRTPNASGAPVEAEVLREQQLLVSGLNAGYRPPDEAAVQDAKAKVQTYITRDYAQYDSTYGQIFSSGHDHVFAQDIAAIEGFDDLPSSQTWDGRTIRGGLIIDPVREQTRQNVANFITHGASSPEYRRGLGSSILQTAGRGMTGTTQVEMVNLLNRVEDPQFNLAKLRYEELRDNPDADPAKLVAALRTFQTAKSARDQDILVMAREISGNENGEMSLDQARGIVIGRIDTIADSFDSDLMDGSRSPGRDIVENGRIDLSTTVDVAVDGAGTYDELLMQTTGGRHQSDVASANLDRDSLGVTGSWWGETSGDQAQQLEINLEGVPENDMDRFKIASMRTRHDAINGTGFISSMTMNGSSQEEAMHSRHARLGERAQAAIIQYNIDHPDDQLPVLSPSELVPLVGDPHPMIGEKLLDDHDNLIGDGPTVDMLTTESALANKSYRDEIGRQESFFTGAITAIVVAVSVLLLFVPGVNVGAAAVLTALLGGAATIAVKAGMRGNRYGWEEAAVDVGRTAIEAATAGAGAAMGGAVKAGTPVLGRLATIGTKLEGALGKMGAAAAREGITNATSGVAMTAMDDGIWSKGFANGMGELVKSGAKGAVTGAISGSVSEAVTKGLNNRLSSTLGEGVDTAVGVSARAGGANVARHAMLQEALSGLTGTTLSESASIAMDIADGKMRLNWAEIGKRLGTAGLREVLTGAARGRIQHKHRQTYKSEMSKIIQRGGDMTPAEAKFMRKLAISAGHEQYGREKVNENAGAGSAPGSDPGRARYFFDSDQAFADGVKAAAESWAALPPSIRAQTSGLTLGHINQLHEVFQKGVGGIEGGVGELRVALATMYPGIDPAALLNGIEVHRKARKTEAHASKMATQSQQGQQSRARNRVLQGVDPETRAALKDAPVSEIAALPPILQRDLAKVLSQGGDVDAIVAKARAAGEDVDGPLLARQIEGLMAAKLGADQDVADARAIRRKEVTDILPDGARDQASNLSDKDIAFLHQLTTAGDVSDSKRKNLVRMLEARLKGIDGRAVLDAAIDTATTGRAAKTAKAEAALRSERLKVMQHVPKDLQPLLSHLPQSALLKIALAQSGQTKMSKADIAALAKTATGAKDIDIDALTHAITQAIRAPVVANQGGFFARVSQRRALLEFVPPQMRSMVKRTPILTVPDDMFFAYVKALGNGEENAVTLRLGGEPVVLIREGAPRHAVGEEGLHVLQMRDGPWSNRLSDLDEDQLEAWPDMPSAEKARLAHLMIEAEISAHLFMQSDLDIRLLRVRDEGARARMSSRQDLVTARIETLQRRAMELASLHPSAFKAMDKGHLATPDWLARPARLFNEEAVVQKATNYEGTADPSNAPIAALTRKSVSDNADALSLTKSAGDIAGFKSAVKAAAEGANAERLKTLNDIVTLMGKVTGSHGDNAESYAKGLTGLVETLGTKQMDGAQEALKGLLAQSDDHPTFLLKTFAQLNEKGVFGWFGDADKSASGVSVIKYLNEYVDKQAGATKGNVQFPSALEAMISGLALAKGVTPFKGFWPAFKAVLDHAALSPQRTLRNNPKDGDILGHFVQASLNPELKSALADTIRDLPADAYAQKIKDEFQNGYVPPVKPRMKYSEVNKPLRVLAKSILDGGDGGLTSDQLKALKLDPSDATDLIALAHFLNQVHSAPPTAKNVEHEVALSLAYAHEMVQMDAFSWGARLDVSKIRPPDKLTFEDIKTFLTISSGGIGADEKRYASALPLLRDMLGARDKGLSPRVFWMIKQFAHPNEGQTFRVYDNDDAPHLTPDIPQLVSSVSEGKKQDFNTLLSEGQRMNDVWEARRAVRNEALVKADKPIELPIFDDGVEVTGVKRKVEVFEIPETASWSDFRETLRHLYDHVHASGLSDKDANAAFVFLKETPSGTASKPKDGKAKVVGNIQGLQLVIRPDGTRSIYVGEKMKVKVKADDATDSSADTDSDTDTPKTTPETKAASGELPLKMEIAGGDSYPGLANDILRDILNSTGDSKDSAIDLLVTALTNGSALDGKGHDPALVAKIKLLKTIVAGSEVLRDEMAAPTLLLALYALKKIKPTQSTAYENALIYPAQILFGHAFFRRTRINAFSQHLMRGTYKGQMKTAGLSAQDVKLMNGIFRTNLLRNQIQGGGLLAFTSPLFLQHRKAARDFAAGDITYKDLGKDADIVLGIVNRNAALTDFVIQRYLINQQGSESSNVPNVQALSQTKRARIIREIIAEMTESVLPELNPPKETPDGT